MKKRKKKDKDYLLLEKVALLLSKQLTKADWMASFWDEIDEIADKDVIIERKKLLKVSGEIIKFVKDYLQNEKSDE